MHGMRVYPSLFVFCEHLINKDTYVPSIHLSVHFIAATMYVGVQLQNVASATEFIN